MGRLIVFEGTDGSGKATQTELLCQTLEKQGIPFRRLSFPRYSEESSALDKDRLRRKRCDAQPRGYPCRGAGQAPRPAVTPTYRKKGIYNYA